MPYADEETKPLTYLDREGNNLPPVAGEIAVPPMPHGRGQSVSRSEGVGILVGTFKSGIEWVCFVPAEFDRMCSAFDRLVEEAKH